MQRLSIILISQLLCSNNSKLLKTNIGLYMPARVTIMNLHKHAVKMLSDNYIINII